MTEGAPKVYFETLGCKVNQYDTDALQNEFKNAGYQILRTRDEALETGDIFVINTCTVTHLADRKSRQFIRRFHKHRPNAVVAVIGCYAQTDPETIKQIEGVDIVLGTEDRKSLVDLVHQIQTKGTKQLLDQVTQGRARRGYEPLRIHPTHRHRARHFIKVQEGCDQFCSYCIVPYARGEIRSRPLEDMLQEARNAVTQGFRELVLTGINLGAYGRDFESGLDLVQLLLTVIELEGDFRIRLSSLEPQEITEELIHVASQSPKICPHFHIPLQSGDDHILGLMNRQYTTVDYLNLLKKLRENNPRVAITTDVMVGFPGEGAEHFENTLSFVKRAQFSDMHVFQYSERKGTRAAEFVSKVSSERKKRRSDILLKTAANLSYQYKAQFIGQTLSVLVDKLADGHAIGLDGHYLKVSFSGFQKQIVKGEIYPVKISGLENSNLMGEILDMD